MPTHEPIRSFRMAKTNKSTFAASFLAVSLFCTPLLAESHAVTGGHEHTNGTMNHDQMNQKQKPTTSSDENAALPIEPGQGAFATIAEIVALLNKDPNTDWSKVDIDALRDHLVDMDEVTLRANAKTTLLDGKVIFAITGEGRTKQAIQAMVPAHAGVLAKTLEWNIKGVRTNSGAVMTIVMDDVHELQKLKSLGFFGVMAIGAHHQAHHLAMAKGGTNVHAHN